MRHSLSHRNLRSLESLTQHDMLALIETATALKRAAQRGVPLQMLRGRNIALLSDDHGSPSAIAFHRAAADQGAQVARVPATDPLGKGPQDVRDRARLLGRLYGAIECQGLPEEEVRALDRESGVPVYSDLGSATHPTRLLADLLTLRELSGKPLGEIKLRFVGEPQTKQAGAVLHALALSGIDLRISMPAVHRHAVAEGVLAGSAHHTGPLHDDDEPEYICEPFNGSGVPLKLQMGQTASPGAVATEQAANQRYLLEAMLACTVA